MLDFEEFDRWFRSARLTLESAKRDLEDNDYCWACFRAQQAAEKALKALLWGLGSPVLSCMLNRLLNHVKELGVSVPC